MAERLTFPSVFVFFSLSLLLPLHAAILRRHESGSGSTLAAQFDLTSSQIKDGACKEGSHGTFLPPRRPSSLLLLFFFFSVCVRETKLFRTVLLKNRACAGATLANPTGEGSRDGGGGGGSEKKKNTPKLIKETQKKNPSGDFSPSFCARVKKVWLKKRRRNNNDDDDAQRLQRGCGNRPISGRDVQLLLIILPRFFQFCLLYVRSVASLKTNALVISLLNRLPR